MSGSLTKKAGNPNRVEWEVPTTHLLKWTTHGKHNNRLHDWRENACGFQCVELEFRSSVSFFLPLQRRRYDQFSGKQRTRFRSHASAFVDRKKGKEVDHLPSPFCSPAKRAFSSSGVVKEKVDGACGDPEISTRMRSAVIVTAPSHTSRERRFSMKRFMSGSLLSFRRWEFVCDELGPNLPPVIGAKVAAGDFAIGSALNSWAALNRNWPSSGNPLIDGYGRQSNIEGQFCLAAAYVARPLDSSFFHAPIIRRRLSFVNRNCLTKLAHGKLGDA